MYKKIIFSILGLLLIMSSISSAQKILFADTEQILNNLPEYQSAKKQMDIYAEQIHQDIEKKNNEITKLKETLQQEQILLSEKARQEREEDIAKKTLALQKYQNDVFNNKGFYFQKRHILIKPIQDKIYDAISEIAQDRGADLVIDKSSSENGQMILYSNSDQDITQNIIEKLNIKIY